ncbi:hypothetical protein EGW08_010737, partial [Elysia chlorotica]
MQSHDRVSTTGTPGEGGGRKSSKPIMEKRRRARINASLAELKSLLLEAIRKEGARHNKMEKADILEMAVKHLRQIQRQQFTGEAGESCVSTRYQLGYQACAHEVSKYLDSNSDEEVELKTKLLNHLANCITSEVFPVQARPGVGADRTGGSTRLGGFSLVGPVSSSSSETQDAFLLTVPSVSSAATSASAPSSSLLSSSAIISSSLVVPPTSTATFLTSPLSHFLYSTSSSLSSALSASSASLSSGVSGNCSAPVIIPIPISPLSIGTVSPASAASGVLSPEKQGLQHHSGSQTAGNNNSSGNVSSTHSLDLSTVRISDDGTFKTLEQNPNNLNSNVDNGGIKVCKSLSMMSSSNVQGLL